MAVSAFLPWFQISTAFGQTNLTGLQVMGGEPGKWLLAWALLGGLTTLFLNPRRATRKWLHDGLSDIVLGISILLITLGDMNHLESIGQTGTPSAIALLGSGGYLAIVSSLLVFVAGIVIEVKSYHAYVNLHKSGITRETTTVHAKPSSGLRGSFSLNEQTVNEEVDSGSPGVYALGYKKEKTFYVRCIGRSDTDVNVRLKEYIGKYDQFKFDTSDTPETAFIKECQLYHAFGGPQGKIPHNKNHPDRPQGMAWSCPMCTALDSQVSSTEPQSGVSTTRKRFCDDCGAELTADVRFCTRCGKPAA